MSNTGHHFSRRTAWESSQGDFAAAVEKARASGRVLLDLTVSNPTRCGFVYDAEATLGPLTASQDLQQALTYDPDPRGTRAAREAVASYYADHGAAVDPDSVVLTNSTSEAYSYLFRLLCNAGDEVLVAKPSYPLFDFLADLDDIVLKPYPLFYDFGWWIDFAELERQISSKTRAILLVHPNNPTGHWTHEAERERLEALCLRHGLALIVDEVFLDYPVDSSLNERAGTFATGEHRALTFVLSGISKIAALPQMKVAWIAAFGPQRGLQEVLSRLEIIADTFLSLSTPSQLALPMWLAGRANLQRQISTRTQSNLDVLRSAGLHVLKVEAGWSAVLLLRGLAVQTDQPSKEVAELLLDVGGVISHPGSFYGLHDKRLIVLSLITPELIFRSGVEEMCRILRTVERF